MKSRFELKMAAKAQIKGNLGFLILCYLVLLVVAGAVSFFVPILGGIAVAVVGPAVGIGFISIFLGLTRGEKPTLETLLNGMPIFLKAFLLELLMGVFIFLWSLLLWVPGIIKALSYMFAPYVLCENREMTPQEALNKSKEITKGRKADIFVLWLSFIPWFLLCSITFGIAFIYVMPYVQATLTNLYIELRGPVEIIAAPAPEPVKLPGEN